MKTRMLVSSVLLLLVMTLIVSATVYGGSETRRGTAGATELLIPVGSRGSALAGSAMSMISGVEAIHWNPAGMARDLNSSSGVEAMFSSLNYLADIQLNYFAVAANLGDFGALGLSLRTLDFGDIPVTTVENPEGTGEMFSPNYITVGLSYARAFTDRIHGGVTAKLVTEKIMRTSASGVAFDFGIQYISSVGLKLGVAMKNLGPEMRFGGEDLETYVALPGQEPGSRNRPVRLIPGGFEFPATLEIGLGYDYTIEEQNVVSVMGDFQNTNFGADEIRFGLEYGWNDRLFVRGGYMVLGQKNEDNIYGPSFGAGLKVPVGNWSVGFDYAYRQADFFDANQWFTVKVGF